MSSSKTTKSTNVTLEREKPNACQYCQQNTENNKITSKLGEYILLYNKVMLSKSTFQTALTIMENKCMGNIQITSMIWIL